MAKRASAGKAKKQKAVAKANASGAPKASGEPPKPRPGGRHAVRFGVIFLVVSGLVYWIVNRPPPDGMVWSAEHGHYHDANGGEIGAIPAVIPEGGAGRVWSEEHGHWHDAEGVAIE